jgi:hypothetical protein
LKDIQITTIRSINKAVQPERMVRVPIETNHTFRITPVTRLVLFRRSQGYPAKIDSNAARISIGGWARTVGVVSYSVLLSLEQSQE